MAIKVWLLLRNEGDTPITVLTKSELDGALRIEEGETNTDPRIRQRFAFGETVAGTPRIPSLSSFAPVTLGPGETTEVLLDVHVGKNPPLKNVEFSYEVDPKFTERFGVWSGVVVSRVLEQRGRRIGDHALP